MSFGSAGLLGFLPIGGGKFGLLELTVGGPAFPGGFSSVTQHMRICQSCQNQLVCEVFYSKIIDVKL